MDPAVTVTGQPESSGAEAAEPSRPEPLVKVKKPKKVKTAKAPVRQSRVEVRKIDLWAVLKVSLCFYLAGLAVMLVAGIVVWLLFDAAGQIHNFEKFMGDILSAKNYRILGGQLLLGASLVGLVIVALLTIFTVIATALFNVFSDLVGGVELTLSEVE